MSTAPATSLLPLILARAALIDWTQPWIDSGTGDRMHFADAARTLDSIIGRHSGLYALQQQAHAPGIARHWSFCFCCKWIGTERDSIMMLSCYDCIEKFQSLTALQTHYYVLAFNNFLSLFYQQSIGTQEQIAEHLRHGKSLRFANGRSKFAELLDTARSAGLSAPV